MNEAEKIEPTDVEANGPRPHDEISYLDIFKQFVLLGWTAFGAPFRLKQHL